MPGAANLVNFQCTGVNAEQRARIFRLARDFAASALVSRNEQYERFYLDSAERYFTNAHLYNDRTRGDRLSSVSCRRS
jgi:4-hydroxyphenylacetate 3-monooxygenase